MISTDVEFASRLARARVLEIGNDEVISRGVNLTRNSRGPTTLLARSLSHAIPFPFPRVTLI